MTTQQKITTPPKDQEANKTIQGLPTVTEGQIVAAMLRSIGKQLIKLAERLEAEAMAGRPPKGPKQPVESARELMKRLGVR